jgi:hypothetical protein
VQDRGEKWDAHQHEAGDRRRLSIHRADAGIGAERDAAGRDPAAAASALVMQIMCRMT